MVTIMHKYEEAYATMKVAVYQPLFLWWFSRNGVLRLSSMIAEMAYKKQVESQEDSPSSERRTAGPPRNAPYSLSSTSSSSSGIAVNPLLEEKSWELGKIKKMEDEVHQTFIRILVESAERNKIKFDILRSAIRAASNGEPELLATLLNDEVVRQLSPIGIAHFYRQHYFNKDEGYGPIEECFTVAPHETLEVSVSTSRKQVYEEIVEVGHEYTSERASEEKNRTEVSDKVSSMIQRDYTASMSISGSYNVAVWQVSANASGSLSESRQRADERVTKNLKETTQKASERITNTYSIKATTYREVQDSTQKTRIIENKTDKPTNYALRRIFKRINVKVQDLGPQLVWQISIPNPGKGLQRSKYLFFVEANELSEDNSAISELIAKPKEGFDSGVASNLAIQSGGNFTYVELRIKTTSDRVITDVTIDTLTGAAFEGGTRSPRLPSQENRESVWDPENHIYTAKIPIFTGHAKSISMSYTYHYKPSDSALQTWEDKKKGTDAEQAEKLQEIARQHLKEKKELITQHSQISPRPANELRREENAEVLKRMVGMLYNVEGKAKAPSLESIETFHRFFDIDSMFIRIHPSWWEPHPQDLSDKTVAEKPYSITENSEPAKLGSSLGWEMQLDGDDRRNEFLNSPWVRVCIPIKKGEERKALQWLANDENEGGIGFSDREESAINQLLQQIEARRKTEDKLEKNAQDYVKINSSVGAPSDPLQPEAVYPIIDEFDVTVPTEGFVYDQVFINKAPSLSESMESITSNS